MGESLASVQQFATPLEQATTSSLEALQAFTLGQGEHQKMNDEAAFPHLKKAVELGSQLRHGLGHHGSLSHQHGTNH